MEPTRHLPDRTLLPARSRIECLVYLELHPCGCGAAGFDRARHRSVTAGDLLVASYEGNCPQCGTARAFRFAMPADAPQPPAFGDAEPSQIIEPHEFLASTGAAAECGVVMAAGFGR
jgi:hypothetical protein